MLLFLWCLSFSLGLTGSLQESKTILSVQCKKHSRGHRFRSVFAISVASRCEQALMAFCYITYVLFGSSDILNLDSCWFVLFSTHLPDGDICTSASSTYDFTSSRTTTSYVGQLLRRHLSDKFRCSRERLFWKKRFLEDISSFCGTTNTPILDFWLLLAWVSNAN